MKYRFVRNDLFLKQLNNILKTKLIAKIKKDNRIAGRCSNKNYTVFLFESASVETSNGYVLGILRLNGVYTAPACPQQTDTDWDKFDRII